MSSLRDEITKSLLRLGRRESATRRALGRASALSAHDLLDGTEFGSYRIVRRLGSGGMGHVHLALDTHLDRHVALKFLPDDLTADPVALHRFYQEAKTASALNHPNILTIYEFSEIGGKHVIVSEFIDGVTLRAALEGNGIDLNTGLDIVAQIASALMAAHAAGVVHRDLKPTNVMIRQDGYAKVIDFGLAKLTQRSKEDRSLGYTLPGSVLGTVGYMSPEQARGDEIDERTDVWSLGVILYEVITRHPPFEGSTDSHVIVSILDHPFQPIPDVQRLPSGLVRVIERALAKERKKRYQTTREFLADLEAVRQAAGPVALPKKSLFRKKAMPLWPLWLIPALLAVAFAVWWWPLDGKAVVLGPEWLQLGPPVAVTQRGDVTLSSISPDGKYLAYVSKGHGNQLFHLLDRKSGTERQLQKTVDDYIGITFSPDSQTVYYVLLNQRQARGQLYDIPISGFGSEPPSLRLEDLDSPITFSPDGTQFAFVRGTVEASQENTAILLMPEGNLRDVRTLVSVKSTEIKGELAWSPKKNWIAAVTYPDHLQGPTRPHVALYAMDSHVRRSYTPQSLRKLRVPVAMDRGSLLLFLGVADDAIKNQLVQLSVPTGEFRSMPALSAPIETLSATADSKVLAAVQADRHSTIWIANRNQLNTPTQIEADAEDITSLAWSGETLIFPSGASGHVNLAHLTPGSRQEIISKPQACVEHQPSVAQNGQFVLYASNCGYHGDDFHIWALDLKDGARRRLTSGSNYDEQADVSPDGTLAFYTSWTANMPFIWKVPTDGGTPTRLSASEAEYAYVSPDGSQIVCNIREQIHGAWEVAILSANDGSVLQRFPHLPIGKLVRWSPDGAALDYLSQGDSPGIWRQPINGAAAYQLVGSGGDEISYFAWNRSGTQLAFIRTREKRDVVLFTRVQH